MDLLIALVVFVAAMITALITKISMTLALALGLVAFSSVAVKRGFKVKEIALMAVDGVKNSLVVIKVMFAIGFVTAAWRISGTITFFVYYGIKVITPPLFLLITFILSCLLSYALGTSFGVAGTVGVIFMALARSGGVDPVITAGVIMSGIYFGDRSAPASSSANLVAGITGTDIYGNVKMMMKTGGMALLLCTVIYGGLSVVNPISGVDPELVASFEKTFDISLWAVIPAVFMLVLPLLKVNVLIAMVSSIVSGVLVAWLIQGFSLGEILWTLVVGYEASGEGLAIILNGGGLLSMAEIIVILALSCSYSGIFDGTHMLDNTKEKIGTWTCRFGRFPIMVAMSMVTLAVFCNQTIAALMCANLMDKAYDDAGATRSEMAMDMENSTIVLAGVVPWSIACSVPLAFMGVGYSALGFSFYLWLIPLCYGLTKARFFKKSADSI